MAERHQGVQRRPSTGAMGARGQIVRRSAAQCNCRDADRASDASRHEASGGSQPIEAPDSCHHPLAGISCQGWMGHRCGHPSNPPTRLGQSVGRCPAISMRSSWRSRIVRASVFALDIYCNSLSIIMLDSCRFSPTCSKYAREAIRRYGVVRGTRRTVCRLLRCHPFGRFGIDPVK